MEGLEVQMKADKHFKLITCESGDYEILLEDGELFTCGHSIGNNVWISILSIAPITVFAKYNSFFCSSVYPIIVSISPRKSPIYFCF